MKMWRKVIICLLFLVLTMPVLFSEGAQEKEKSEQVVLQFPHPQWGEEGFKDWWEEVTDAFHKDYPNIRIEGSSVAFDTYLDRLVLQVRSGNAPDLIFQVSSLPTFMAMGAFETLDGRLQEENILENWGPTQDTWPIWKGETKAIILMNNTWTLLYNKKMFDEAGIDAPPTNTDEFYEVAKKLTKDTNNDGKIDQFGYALPLTEVHSYNMGHLIWAHGFGGNYTTDGYPSANDPDTIAGLEFMKKMYDEGFMPKNTSLAEARQMFLAGNVGMWVDINGFYGAIHNTAPDMVDVIKTTPMPFPDNRTLFNAVTVGIYEGSQNKDEAWEYIKFLTKPEWQKKVLEICRAIPGEDGLVDDDFISENQWFESYSKGMNEYAISSVPPGFPEDGEAIKKVVNDAITNMLTNNIPVEKAMDELQQELINQFVDQ